MSTSVEGMQSEGMPSDLIMASEARKLLGVSTVKMAELVREYLRTFPDPLDKRVKLVSRAEVLALSRRSKVG